MTSIDINDYTREIEGIYEGENYSVRDNGAVLRHSRTGKRVRPNDNYWTFGKMNSANPYLHLSTVRIHRVVATVFHGEPPNPQYVVDHIDTNCRNNRPQNLRWVTRLENALMNPITRKKIESICGSVETFLENPSMLNAYEDVERNFSWMRTVTQEEAQNCKSRMSIWATSDKKPSGGSWGEWVYEPIKEKEINAEPRLVAALEDAQIYNEFAPFSSNTDKNISENSLNKWIYEPEFSLVGRELGLVMALTKRCVQSNWRVPSYFPCCPEEIERNPLEAYFNNLKIGAVFAYNEFYPNSTILEFLRKKDNLSILVMCEKEDFKPFSIAEITFENGFFVHSNLGTYFDKQGADKVFCIEQGLEWAGGDTFDDFC